MTQVFPDQSREDDSRSQVFASNSEANLPFDEVCRETRLILKSVVEARLDARLLQRVDASDIVQEALMEAFSRLADFQRRRPMPMISWLRETTIQQLRIAVRRHLTAAKRSVARQVSYDNSSVAHLVQQMTATQLTADDRYAHTERAILTRQALLRLPPLDREILLLRYVNELTNQEAAVLLKVTETVASKRHCRALMRLQRELEQSP